VWARRALNRPKRRFSARAGWLSDGSKSEETEFKMPTCNSYLRRALREHVEAAHPALLMETRKDETYDRLFVLRFTAQQQAAHAVAKVEQKERKFGARCGFRQVFNLLADAKKPLVGLARGDTAIRYCHHDCHWRSFLRDIYRYLAVIAVIFGQNDSRPGLGSDCRSAPPFFHFIPDSLR
jgi:hypothetical protein